MKHEEVAHFSDNEALLLSYQKVKQIVIGQKTFQLLLKLGKRNR